MNSNKNIFITVSVGAHVCAAILFFYLTTSHPKFYSTIVVSLLELSAVEELSSPTAFSPEVEKKFVMKKRKFQRHQ